MDKLEKTIFQDITGEDDHTGSTEVESLCMNCLKNGTTRLLLTKIPFYKEIILMSFECDHCGFKNNEIQSGGEILQKGCRIILRINNASDLNRKVVKSDFSSVKIVELDFEIPSQSQKGEITTIEGILDRSIKGLEQDQEVRCKEHPEAATQIDEFCTSLQEYKTGNIPFTFILEDISGNCYIENPNAPSPDKQCSTIYFTRNEEQNHILGIYTKNELADEELSKEASEQKQEGLLKTVTEEMWPLEELHGEVLQFKTLCPECRSPCETNMKLTTIPHFKDVVIMATVCDVCGNKTNEVKSGSGIEDYGIRFEILVKDKTDFSRDVLKSETCSLNIPELDCEIGSAAICGRFTTVEGLLNAVKDQLIHSSSMFYDSQDEKMKQKLENFVDALEEVLNGTKQIHLILDDPTGNSYIQSLADTIELDDRLKITKYTRTHEQNEELGINDMITENYETKHES